MPDRIRINKEPWAEDYEIRYGREEGQNWSIMTQALYQTVPRGAIVPAAFTISPHAAQELMNQLWQYGIRPTDNSGSTGHLKALEDHLEDLRRLVFGAQHRVDPQPITAEQFNNAIRRRQ